MGDLRLPNRIVMAPLTRQRAANPGHVPTKLQAQYYAQRASAGVIISEGTAISPEAYGWTDTPGLWSEEQISGYCSTLSRRAAITTSVGCCRATRKSQQPVMTKPRLPPGNVFHFGGTNSMV